MSHIDDIRSALPDGVTFEQAQAAVDALRPLPQEHTP